MSRTTIDFGIDLGTTNSAIAAFTGRKDSPTEIFKNDLEQDITPSAIHFRKSGEPLVGFRAKQTLTTPRLDDTAIEFKRQMGTDHVYIFKGSGQRRKPEELSAEVLRTLKADAQQKTGEVIEAAVITVPAAFELHQCSATKNAAQLAGFKESILLLEPTAAALAFGFNAETAKAYWLVYDFGGGTFDATIIKAEDGTIHVVNHGGDNFLGGSDIDKALVSKIIAPRLIEDYGLEDFDWAHAGQAGRWHQAFARLKAAAEQAKIELSRKEKTSLDPDTASNLKDETTGEVVIDEVDMEITRDELIRVAEPFITRSTDIALRVLTEKNLSPNAIEKVVLVGGPTVAPYFRDMLASKLRIKLEPGVDPFTVVARGAAIFAATQKLNAGSPVVATRGEYAINLEHKPAGMDSAPTVGGKVSGSGRQDFTGFTLELVNTKTQWRSGKIALRPDGVFLANLHAERGERNTFAIELFDPAGRKQKTTPDVLTYTIMIDVEKPPLVHSMGIALANNEYARFFAKGSGLPQQKNWPEPFRTVKPLKQGQSGEFLWIPIIEGENDLADRNRLIKRVAIEAEHIRRDLPAGSEVDITLKIDESHIVSLEAYVPLLDEEFKFKIDLGSRRTADADFLKKDFDNEMKRFREVKTKAAGASAGSAENLVNEVEQSPLLQNVKETLAAAMGDPDAAAKVEKLLLELKLKLDEAANALEWPALVKEARGEIADLNKVAPHGTDDQKQRVEELAEDIEDVIRQNKPDSLRNRIRQANRLYFEIVMAQRAWWVYQLREMEKQEARMNPRDRAARLLDQGRDCIDKGNDTGLQNIVRQLWDLLPPSAAQAAKRGYEADLIQ